MILSLLVSIAFANELSAKDLTIGNVTMGKSNLYNPVGFFGTNMFKKQGDGSGLCYKGDDGTILAFASSAEGGRDQIITDAKLISAGQDYEFEKDCKASKKVSKSLELLGVKLGESLQTVMTAKGEPSRVGDAATVWQFHSEVKKRTVSTDLEVSAVEDKITKISVHHTEKR